MVLASIIAYASKALWNRGIFASLSGIDSERDVRLAPGWNKRIISQQEGDGRKRLKPETTGVGDSRVSPSTDVIRARFSIAFVSLVDELIAEAVSSKKSALKEPCLRIIKNWLKRSEFGSVTAQRIQIRASSMH